MRSLLTTAFLLLQNQVELIQATAKSTGIRTASLEWALVSRAGKAPTKLKQYDPIAAEYVDTVEQFADVVNAL